MSDLELGALNRDRLIARIEALETALGRLLAHVGFGNASQHEPNCKCVIHEACATLTALAKEDEDE